MGEIFCAAFGPNGSYFFASPTRWSRYGVPNDLNALFLQRQPIKEVREIALGSNGSWFVLYKMANGFTNISYDGLPDSLVKWLVPVEGGPLVRDTTSLQVTLGPNNSYFAFDKSGASWENLPAEFNQALAERIGFSGNFNYGQGPQSVALGANDTFVFIDTTGNAHWSDNLADQAPALNAFLCASKSLAGVCCILNSSIPNVYIIFRPNGGCNAMLPPSMQRDFNAFAHEWHQASQPKPVTRLTGLSAAGYPSVGFPTGGYRPATVPSVGASSGPSALETMNNGFQFLNTVAGVMGGPTVPFFQ